MARRHWTGCGRCLPVTSDIGIDISHYQPADVPGDWLFIVVKLTEGMGDPHAAFDAQWANAARTMRGVYHYARPAASDGATQAKHFCDIALASGFTPGTDIWLLDVEGQGNETVSGKQWQVFVDTFMPVALRRLGVAGFLYVGAYFQSELAVARTRYNWWVPAYGVNDGNVHPLPAGVRPVVHQYTSVPFDKNVVVDKERWEMLTARPLPVPEPTPGPPADEETEMLIVSSGNSNGSHLITGDKRVGIPHQSDETALAGAGVKKAKISDDFYNAIKATLG